jgi:hypothetical protein
MASSHGPQRSNLDIQGEGPMKALLAACLALLYGVAFAQCIGPTSYSDCVLQSVGASANEATTRAIQTACRSKYHDQTVKDYPVDGTVLKQFEAQGQYTESPGFGTFSGRLYHSTGWTITRFTVALKLEDASGSETNKALDIGFVVPPRIDRPFCITLRPGNLRLKSWAISTAYGVRNTDR